MQLIRHGEKPSDGGTGLSEKGWQRANCVTNKFSQGENKVEYVLCLNVLELTTASSLRRTTSRTENAFARTRRSRVWLRSWVCRWIITVTETMKNVRQTRWPMRLRTVRKQFSCAGSTRCSPTSPKNLVSRSWSIRTTALTLFLRCMTARW